MIIPFPDTLLLVVVKPVLDLERDCLKIYLSIIPTNDLILLEHI
jgi:hypothetical protein